MCVTLNIPNSCLNKLIVYFRLWSDLQEVEHKLSFILKLSLNCYRIKTFSQAVVGYVHTPFPVCAHF